MKAVHNPLKTFSSQGLPYANNDEDKAKESAGTCSDQSRAAEVFDHSPNDGAKNTASIQGKPWNQVEQSEDAVNEGEIFGYS